MLKDNNNCNVIRHFCFAVVLILFIGATLFAQTHDSEATARFAVLSEDFSADDIDECRRLIKSGADVDIRNKYGVTPLFQASGRGYSEIVKLLLAANADVDAALTEEGITPLWIASQNGHTEIVKLLLAANADIDAIRTTDGATPALIAIHNGHLRILRLLEEAAAKE